jgi:hypothetical protein
MIDQKVVGPGPGKGEVVHTKLIFIAGLLAVIVAGGAAGSESTGIDGDYIGKADGWRFNVSPYALLASQSTDVAGQALRQSFDDLSSMTNFGFQLAASVTYQRWSLSFDGTYADLGSTADKSVIELDLNIKQYMADLRLGYVIVNKVDYGDESSVVRGWAMDVNAGAKYWENDVTLGYRIAVGDTPLVIEDEFTTRQSWWDPMIGVKARIFMNRSVLLGLYGSIGGFGIGNASDLSTDFIYTNTFKVSRVISVTAGFRSFHYDRTDGQGDDEVTTKVRVLGPLLGMSFVF